MQTSFNSSCPYHERRCKCSLRRKPPAESKNPCAAILSTQQSRPISHNRDPKLHLELHGAAVYNACMVEAFLHSILPSYAQSSYSELLWTRIASWNDPSSRKTFVPILGLLSMDSIQDSSLLRNQGRHIYGRMINIHRHMLLDGKLDVVSNLRRTCHLLVCELYTALSTSSNAWLIHVPAIVSLVQAIGPGLMQHPMAQTVLRFSRHVDIQRCLVLRQPTIFASKRWRTTLPWSGTGTLDDFYAIIVQIPRLLNLVDSAPRNSQHSKVLKKKLQTVHSDLESWLNDFRQTQNTESSSVSQRDISKYQRYHDFTTPELIALHPSVLHFPSLLGAMAHAFYWSMKLILLTAEVEFTTIFSTADVDVTTQFSIPHHYPLTSIRASGDLHASLLCKSIPYFLDEARGNVSICSNLALPLRCISTWYACTKQAEEARVYVGLERRLAEAHKQIQWSVAVTWCFAGLLWIME